MPKIDVNHVHFKYNDKQPLLTDISIHFETQATAIVGQNGAGKTTLVKLLKGLLQPTKGAILINGISTKEVDVAKLAAYIGLVFQNPNDQIFKNTVIEEVQFGPLSLGKNKEEARQLAMDALASVHLSHLLDVNPYDVSLSERKLISIASILAMDTGIIIFDEPTIAQDWKGKALIKSVMKQLQQDGKLVLAISHDMDFVAEVFERTIVMAEGRVLLDGHTQEVFSKTKVLEQAYLTQPSATLLANELGISQVFLTMEELINFVTPLGISE